eukprot:2565917-Amphidinium_carterae.2
MSVVDKPRMNNKRCAHWNNNIKTIKTVLTNTNRIRPGYLTAVTVAACPEECQNHETSSQRHHIKMLSR